MADLPQQDTIKQYLTNGTTDSFVVNFYVPVDSDNVPAIDVYVQLDSATPVPESDIQEWGVDYTYTSNLDPITGGTVTFIAGHVPAASSIVTIVRNVPAALNAEFSEAQNFSGQNLDDALDTLLLIEQQNKTYAFQRNLSYIVNSYLPSAELQANTQIPVLGNGEIWIGSSGGGVVAAVLEQGPDTSTLRSELANEQPIVNGAHLVGYYDTVNLEPTNVRDMLNTINTEVARLSPIVDDSFVLIGKQILNVGSGTYTPTTGTKWCWARAVAGGGAGGGATGGVSSYDSTPTCGGGGGSGGYAEKWFVASSQPYVVGAKGTGRSADSGLGGSTTTLGAGGNIITVYGGAGGEVSGSDVHGISASGGDRGLAITGDLLINGAYGGYGTGLAVAVSAEIYKFCLSGSGANSPLGSGGPGQSIITASSMVNGLPANGYGAGGGGAAAFGQIVATGGNGSDGIIVIFEFGANT